MVEAYPAVGAAIGGVGATIIFTFLLYIWFERCRERVELLEVTKGYMEGAEVETRLTLVDKL